jgi:hypothetical protein
LQAIKDLFLLLPYCLYFKGGVGAVRSSDQLLHSLSAVCFGMERNRPKLNCRDTNNLSIGVPLFENSSTSRERLLRTYRMFNSN